MAKKWPPRPVRDFKIISVPWLIEIEATHRQAGFSEVKYDVVQRRFWQLLSFLTHHNYLVREHQTSLDEITPNTVLMNFDLNDGGYSFAQRYLDKWVSRLYKDKGAEAEWEFLEKWHAQFIADCPGSCFGDQAATH